MLSKSRYSILIIMGIFALLALSNKTAFSLSIEEIANIVNKCEKYDFTDPKQVTLKRVASYKKDCLEAGNIFGDNVDQMGAHEIVNLMNKGLDKNDITTLIELFDQAGFDPTIVNYDRIRNGLINEDLIEVNNDIDITGH